VKASRPAVMGRRRWLRAVLPLAVVLALIALTIAAHIEQQPDPTDKSFLSPVSAAGDGGERLAARLTAAGVPVDRRTGTLKALAAAATGAPATVLITTPGLVYPSYLTQLRDLPGGSRVVLIAPDRRAVARVGLDADPTGPRWTAAAPAAGCSAPWAVGRAAVTRWRYRSASTTAVTRCYDGGVLETAAGGVSITLVGAVDAFRNDRAGEHDNQALAAGLLTRNARVVWLDLHKHEEPPPATSDPGSDGGPTDPATTEPAGKAGDSGSDDGQSGSGNGQSTDPGGTDGNDGGGDSPLGAGALGQAFPPAVWATALLILLAGLALAAASARRLGAPVAEPLPVHVRAAETVRGLGGLYRRARARDTSLATVQAAAVGRLAEHFGMPADSPMADVAARVAAATSQPVEDVRVVLGGAAEKSDRGLARAATAVQSLVRYVTQQRVIDEGTAQ
jgi:hypothetical protein